MNRWIGLLALLVLVASNASASVGMVTRLTGKAEFCPVQGSDWKPLRLMRRLEAGDRVRCATDSEAVITIFASAEQCTVAAGSTVTLDAKGIKGAQKVAGLRGSGIQIARAMAGDRPGGFEARPAQAHQRLQPNYPGWFLEGERELTWTAIPRAAAYTFTLFDKNDNVVWSQRVGEAKVQYPAELPFFALRRPYVWRLIAFGESGKPLPESRWGILTFLSEKDAQQLAADAKELAAQAKSESKDTTLYFLLAEHYRSYGALEKALEEIYREISRYALILRTPTPPTR